MRVEGDYIAETLNLLEYVEIKKEDQQIQNIIHTNITQTQHCYKQLTNLRNPFKVEQGKQKV
jgi:hypothetical protein